MQESPGSIGVDGGYVNNVPAFLTKLWMLVEDPDTNHLICWSTMGTSFHVFDQGIFAKEVLPKYFKHNNMASFVRQLNMYGFRKVVNVEQSGLLKPEKNDTEFQHTYFLQGHEHLLEHIKRKVSILRCEETKFRQEDLSKLLYEVQVLHNQQEIMECQIQDMKQHNEVLWQEVVSLRQNHTQQQKVMNKLMQFLFSQMQASLPNTVEMKRKVEPQQRDERATCGSGATGCRHLFYIQSPSTEAAPCFTSNALTIEPISADVTDMSQPSAMTIQREETRERCPIIKAEPVSPAVHTCSEDVSCGVCSEPPVLPLAMVQAILEGRGSGSVERRSKRAMDRSETVESVDISFDELQLLLRNPQHRLESSSSSVDELANIFIPAAMSQYMYHCQEGEVCNMKGCEEQ